MNSDTKTDFLGREPIFPLLLKMGIPAAVGMLVSALYNIIDTIFVGLGVGPLAIAALSIIFPLQMIVSALAHALGVGTASIVSRRLGEKRVEDAAAAIGTAFTITFAVTLVLVVLVLIFTRPILFFFGATQASIPYALEYTRIVASGFLFFALSMCASCLIRAEGNPKASMISMLMGALINTALDPILIFGFHMGVKGAAIATIVSQLSSCIYLCSIYLRGKSHVPLLRKHLRVRWDIFQESAILGLPIFIQSAGMSLMALVINTTLGRYGGDPAIIAYGMIQRIVMVIIMPIIGIIQGFQPIAGYNYGAGNYHRVRASLKIAATTTFGISLVGYLIMMLCPTFLMGLFTRTSTLIESSASALRIVALFAPLASIQILGSTYFQAIGKRWPSLVLGVSRQFLFLIPIVLTLPLFLGVKGVWLAFPVTDLASTAITLILLQKELRKLSDKEKWEECSVKT